MAATEALLPYELFSSSPGFLHNKPEWEAANNAYPDDFDFGPLPKGWPTQFSGSKVWSGNELEDSPSSYIYTLTNDEIQEIDEALMFWKSLAKSLSAIQRAEFPLPQFGHKLRALAENIYHGVGIQILRGFPIKNYSKEDQAQIFLGVNSWIGDRRLDQGAKRGIVHIKSITSIEPSKRGKIYVSAQDTNAQSFHNDAGSDIVGLLAVSLSGFGGESTVASAARVYNHLAKTRPDILRVLAERKFRWRARGIPDEGVNLIHHKDGQLYLNFSTRPFIGYGEMSERDSGYPVLTDEEREALGGWQWASHQYSLKTTLQEGDFEWVNNTQFQHARRAYSDDPDQPRHLLRVWLRDSHLAPGLPADIENKFEAMFEQAPENYPLDAIEEDNLRKETGIFTGSCKDETAKERLETGGITGDHMQRSN
ncbi:taurine catabolism dioxygenase family [Fusarium sp. NRRL 25303]|nr:taurine catabolism dioxygenase family [Fusarium sp. NRRL 25303]